MKTKIKIVPLEKLFNKAGIVFCPTCKRGYTDPIEKTFIKEISECSSCDHTALEALQQARDSILN
jgi:uncharacterized Zn finger protein (UPF0148 family)